MKIRDFLIIAVSLFVMNASNASEYFKPYFELDKGYTRYASVDARSVEHFEISAGLQMFDYFALEASYLNFGSFAYTINEVLVARDADTGEVLVMEGTSEYSIDPTAYTYGALVSLPIFKKNKVSLKYGEYDMTENELLEFRENGKENQVWNRTDGTNPESNYKGKFYSVMFDHEMAGGSTVRIKYSKYETDRNFKDIDVLSVGVLFF